MDREEGKASSLFLWGVNIMPRETIREILKKHSDELMSVPGVVGVAEGESGGRPCIRVFVVHRNSELLRRLPGRLGGYPVLVEESGEFRALTSRT